MATVYKIKVKIVSDWGNYPEEQIAEIVKEAIEMIRLSKIRVDSIEVKEIS
jgi:hypothetical protein